MTSILSKSGLLLMAGLLVVACAEERDPIDRVQPYALKKEFFIGPDYNDTRDDPEFYGRTTVTDVGYGASQDLLFPSTIGQNVARIKWEVTEDYLIARSAYERIDASDGLGAPKKDNRGNAVGSETHDGQIVAMFSITKHFDIVNDYNPVTGEKMNVVGENAVDRPWYERDYVRVDWSRNNATDTYDFDVLSFVGMFGTTYEPLSYYVDDPNDPDAPVFDLENGYFDVTTKAFAKPGTIDLSQWGIARYPACFLPLDFFGGSFPMGNCNPVELTLRSSFRRVVDTDYEPAEHDGGRFSSFGGFVTERYGYARNYGMTDTLHHRLLNRYNIWQRSHYYTDPDNMVGEVACYTPEKTPFGADPHRDLNNDGTEDECEKAGEGSRCDTFKQKCTLPFSQRVEKPLVWYYTKGSDLRYFEPSDQGAHEWDVALRVAVQTARYAECKRTDGGDACDTKYPVYHGQIDDGWDAIVLAREVDACRRTDAGLADPTSCNGIADSVGKVRGYDPGVIAIAKMPEMIVLCHSPVQAHDPMACGERRLPTIVNDDGVTVDATSEDCTWAVNLPEGDVTDEIAALIEACDNSIIARLGDLRFDTINVFHQPQTPSPWGIMVSAIDPITGENISTSANVWSWVNDYWSQLVVDQIRVIKGDLDASDVTGATWTTNYGRATEAASRGGVAGTMSKNFVDARIAEFATGKADVKAFQNLGSQLQVNKLQLRNQLNEVRHKFLGVKADGERMNGNSPIYAARAAALAGTEIEAEMMSPAMRQLNGISNIPLSEEVMAVASPLRGASFDIQRELKRMIKNAMHKRGTCIIEANMAEAPLSVAPFADILEEKFGPVKGASEETFERMRDYIARKVHYSVVTHEMGHSISHRHNFVSSSDSWNYRPQYWQLRTKDGTVNDVCTDLSPTGEDCVGPRYFDPVTDAEAKGMIWSFMSSSAMEYPGETTQDFLGIGSYDFAATRLFYGDVTDVLMDASFVKGTTRFSGVLNKLNGGFGGLLGFNYDATKGTEAIHYSQLVDHYSLISNCKPIADINAFKPGNWDTNRDGEWNPVLDGLIVSPEGNGKYTRCQQQKVDYVPWTALQAFSTADMALLGAGMKPEYMRNAVTPKDKWGTSMWGANDAAGRPLVGYGFATDRWADIGNVAVYRHDNGADTFEIFNFMMSQRELNHIWDAYRRDRAAFSVKSYMGRILGRYNEKMRDGAKGLGLYRNMTEDFALGRGENPDTTWQMLLSPTGFGQVMRDPIISAGMAFDAFARELTRPQSGPYNYSYSPETDWQNDPEGTLISVADMGLSGSVEKSEIKNAYLVVPDGPFVPEGSKYKAFDVFSPGGALIENQLAEGQGDYDAEYTMTAGSYYNKSTVGYLMSESADNFISDSLMDFTDPRYRAVALAHLFPDGYRRLLGNMLTNDTFMKGPRVACDEQGKPLKARVTAEGPLFGAKLITEPLGWVSWWGETPRVCFAGGPSPVCDGLYNGGEFDMNDSYPNMKAMDPQVGWEQQKHLMLNTWLYIGDNEKSDWYEMLAVTQANVGDVNVQNRIELHDPESDIYIAKTFGREEIFGRRVQRGVGARVLEYANGLINRAYVNSPIDHDSDGTVDWYVPTMGVDGKVRIKYDPSVSRAAGVTIPSDWGPCTATDSSGCRCEDNRACLELRKYIPVVKRMQWFNAFVTNLDLKGIY